MLGSIGPSELIVILVIALLVFGPRRLPELGRALGRTLTEFRRASSELHRVLEEDVRLEEQTKAAAQPREPITPIAGSGTTG
jgi:sec-independent protein translocase protein TatA